MNDIVQELNDAAASKSGASLRHGCVECGLSSAMCSNAADEIDRLRAALATAQAERDRAHQSALDWKATWEQTQDALTEARRVLREVLPVECEHVHHPKRDQHPFGAACPVLTRASALLAQEAQ